MVLMMKSDSHLKQKVVFKDPLHGDHQEILQLELSLLDLHGTLLWRKIITTAQQKLKSSTEYQNQNGNLHC